MKTSLRTLALAAILLAPSTAVFAAAPKTYQVTGPILEVTDSHDHGAEGQGEVGDRPRRRTPRSPAS